MGRKRKLPEGMRERNGSYYADFYAGGRRVRKRLSTNLGAAKEILNDMRARADKADFNLLDNDYSLAELKDQFLRHCKQALKPSSVARYSGCLENILSRLSANRASQILMDNVLIYRHDRLNEGISPCTINKEVGALGTMLRWGVKPAKLIGSNPLSELTPLPNDHPKEGRPLSTEEVDRLLERSKQPWRDIWYAFLVTGLRKDELATLTFRDVDWVSRELVVRGGVSKNHRERRIPIDAGLWEILKKQEASRPNRQPGTGKTPKRTAQIQARFSREHVFVTTQNTPLTHRSGLYNAFMRSCGLASIQTRTFDSEGRLVEHVDLHSLRRTFTTSLIASGADPKSVQELLGHRTLDMTMRVYAKIHTQTKRQALGKLPYGKGSLAPEGVLEYPGNAKAAEGSEVQKSHHSVTSPNKETGT
jgi:integrase